nr:hypothetical protein [Tanacetum cinerariifolium]
MVEDFMEVFMDDFSEKCHFMAKERIVLGKKFRAGIEVDRAKINVIAKLPYPTNIKGVRSFLGHAEFYRSKQDAKPRLIRWVFLIQGFNIEIKGKKRAKKLAADHLSRLENPDLGTFTEEEEIADEFPDEHLMILKGELNDDEPWYADYVNCIVGKIVPSKWTKKKKKKKKGSSNTSNVDLSSVSHSKLNKDVKRYSRKDLLPCNNSHLRETSSAYVCNDVMNVSCNSRLYDSYDENNLFIFDDESVRIYLVSKMSFRKKL